LFEVVPLGRYNFKQGCQAALFEVVPLDPAALELPCLKLTARAVQLQTGQFKSCRAWRCNFKQGGAERLFEVVPLGRYNFKQGNSF